VSQVASESAFSPAIPHWATSCGATALAVNHNDIPNNSATLSSSRIRHRVLLEFSLVIITLVLGGGAQG
jgi:hypothetical protein